MHFESGFRSGARGGDEALKLAVAGGTALGGGRAIGAGMELDGVGSRRFREASICQDRDR